MNKFEIEFCEKWNYHPEFDRVSKQIRMKYLDVKIIPLTNFLNYVNKKFLVRSDASNKDK